MWGVWVFTAQGLSPKSGPKENWKRRFCNLSETHSPPFLLGADFEKGVKTMVVQRSFILTEA